MNLTLFGFPISLILALAFLGCIVLTYNFYKKSAFLHGRTLSIVVMAVLLVLTAIEGTVKLNLFHNIFFLFVVLANLYLVGLCTLDAIVRKMKLSFICVHLGFFLIFFGAFFGAPDFVSAALIATKDKSCSYATGSDGLTIPLDFKLTLKEFKIETYEDGKSPKQYISTIDVDGRVKTTSVNHPCLYKGWMIYQSDYDRRNGQYTVLRLVRDPWLPVIFLGMAVLAIGVVIGFRQIWDSPKVVPIIIGLAVVFGGISLARINFGTLMPALRSLWFVPHLIIYMLAYSVMAISLVTSLSKKPKLQSFSLKMLSTSSSLLVLGMLCGAVWAKMAWGDYWTWDAKECWAAVTWFLTLVGLHLHKNKKRIIIVLIILASFLAMQITWYGVNYLPSAKYSMHTYNTK